MGAEDDFHDSADCIDQLIHPVRMLGHRRKFIRQRCDGNATRLIKITDKPGLSHDRYIMAYHYSFAIRSIGYDDRMPEHIGLSHCNLIGFVTIVDVDKAKSFYGDTLGLRLVSEEPPYALVFDANGIMLRLGMAKQLPPVSGTVLGWQVTEIESVVRNLAAAGVRFERYGFVEQDDSGIWTAPTGARVAWFKDPDGNILSISEHPEAK